MKRNFSLICCAVALSVVGGDVLAAGVGAQFSQSGLRYIGAESPNLVPAQLVLPASEEPGTVTMGETNLDLTVEDLRLVVPAPGQLRIDATVDIYGQGGVTIIGANCNQSTYQLDNGRFVIDFYAEVLDDALDARLDAVELLFNKNQIDVDFAGCTLGGLFNTAVDVARTFFYQKIVTAIEEAAISAAEPQLETLLASFGEMSVAVDSFGIAANVGVEDIQTSAFGVGVSTDIDVVAAGDMDGCVGNDPGEPQSQNVSLPSLAQTAYHAAFALELGVVNDSLYHLWRTGFMCINDASLLEMGIELPLDAVSSILAGFPPGTHYSLEIVADRPPELVTEPSSEIALGLVLNELEITLIARTPAGEETPISMVVDTTAAVELGVDHAVNALVLQVRGVELGRLEMDADSAAALGFDVDRLRVTVQDLLLPPLLAELGGIPLTGPVVGIGNFYMILRSATTSSSHMRADVDLFHAPLNDSSPPHTSFVSYPQTIVSPDLARVVVEGSDTQVPEELLRYQLRVDGQVVNPVPSYIREFNIGESGVTKTYRVEIAAMDLADNVDPTPATIDLTIDGVKPTITVIGATFVKGDAETHTIEWATSDDLTPQLTTTVEVWRFEDANDAQSAVLIEERSLARGTAGQERLTMPKGYLYKAVIRVQDDAGNENTASVLYSLGLGGGGCQVGQDGVSLGIFFLILAAIALSTRRKRLES